MAIPLVVNGAVFEYPQNFDDGWGVDATGWAQAVTSGMLSMAGGSFPLTAQTDFGPNFGIKVKSIVTETASPSTAGYMALAHSDTIGWRNFANNGNLLLSVDNSDMLRFNGVVLSTTSLTHNFIYVGDATNMPASVAMSGDATIVDTGVLTIANGAITNVKVANAAAIAVSKLAAQTASRAATFDGSGFLAPSAVTTTELGYVGGVTSPIQSQINAISASTVPSGTMVDFGGMAAPAGWLLCDGSAVSRTTYSSLFTAIGTTWGVGDGSTTFNLPNMTRRVGMGSGGAGTGVIGNTVGNTGGAETVTLSTAEMPSHSHTITDPGHTHQRSNSSPSINVDNTGSTRVDVFGTGPFTGSSITSNSTTSITVNNTGGGGAHNNVQPAAIVLKIIKI